MTVSEQEITNVNALGVNEVFGLFQGRLAFAYLSKKHR